MSRSSSKSQTARFASTLIVFSLCASALFFLSSVALAQTRLLVIAPHPDDDIITSAGVIYRARHTSPVIEVWVMYMTNGDVAGRTTGLQRQVEAVDAQALLGVPEDHLVFLGYPDQSLQTLRLTNVSMPFDSPNPDVGTTTFGTRGLGSAPYSRTRTGTDATNTGNNVIADMVHFLNARRPTDIFTVNENERHPDHITTYNFLMDVLPMVSSATYNPTVHRTAVWDDSTVWPQAPDATQYTAPLPPARQSRGDWGIDLPWAERESLDVPLVMQVNDWTQNIKARAIDAHHTQGGFSGRKDSANISCFVHKDEFFWTARALSGSRPPVPNAGLDQVAAAGASAAFDGTGSLVFDGRTLTYAWRQSEGPAVTLSGANTARPSFVVPGVAQGTALAFELRVSDGVSTSVADAVTVRVGAPPPPDAGVDAGTTDAGTDSGVDAGIDAGVQSGSDSGAGADSGIRLDAARSDDAAQIDAEAGTGALVDVEAPNDATATSDAAADTGSEEADAGESTSAWPGDEDWTQDIDPITGADGGAPQPRAKDSGCAASPTPDPGSGIRLFSVALAIACMLFRRQRSR
jgi:LmbE family N-acetylglucosaminyl deacetylase